MGDSTRDVQPPGENNSAQPSGIDLLSLRPMLPSPTDRLRTVPIPFVNPHSLVSGACALNPDGSVQVGEPGNGFSRLGLDQFGSYLDHHVGPNKVDNYEERFTNKDNLAITTRTDAKGNVLETASDGFEKIIQPNGDWTAKGAPAEIVSVASFDAQTGVLTQFSPDGNIAVEFQKEHRTECTDRYGTKTTKWPDGSVKAEGKDASGHDIGRWRHPDHGGGYTENGWGPAVKDQYDETFDPKTGITTRIEGQGTEDEKTTIRLPDGLTRVLAKNGKNYEVHRDGSEHHWGKENFDKPPFDYKHDGEINKQRELLRRAVHEHIASARRTDFAKDMEQFEIRAKREFLPPAEIAKTYQQTAELLNAASSATALSADKRALLAEGVIHQSAYPEETRQGAFNSCGVTSLAEHVFVEKPSSAAKIVKDVALTGEWNAPDGKAIKIDQESLKVLAKESVFKSFASENRSFTTQVLNLAMTNDGLQRRVPPSSYVFRALDPTNPEDTGERQLDSQRNMVVGKQYNSAKGVWETGALSKVPVTDWEVAQTGKMLLGDRSHFIAVDEPWGDVESVNDLPGLEQKLVQLKSQRQFPVTMGVDGGHYPIAEASGQSPDYNGHWLTIDAYNPKNQRLHLTNQWVPQANRWTDVDELFKNAKGDYASLLDGVDSEK